MFFNISCGEIKHVYLFSQEAVRPLLTPNEECSTNPLGTSLLKSPNKRVNPLLIWRAEESARLRNTPVWLTQQGSLYSYFLASNCPPVRASDFYLDGFLSVHRQQPTGQAVVHYQEDVLKSCALHICVKSPHASNAPSSSSPSQRNSKLL